MIPKQAAIVQDLRAALRQMTRRPAQAILSILIVTCAVAAASSLFSIGYTSIVQPLSFPDSTRLVAIFSVRPDNKGRLGQERFWDRGAISWSGWSRLQKEPVFESVGTWARVRPLWGYPAQDQVDVWYISHGLLRMLGAEPRLGRLFTANEDHDRQADAVILSYECWQRRYGGRESVIGETATFSLFVGEQQVKTIVGVLKPGIRLRGRAAEFYLPMGERASPNFDTAPAVFAIGKLAQGATIQQADQVVQAIVPQSIASTEPVTAQVVTLRDEILGRSAPPAWLLVALTISILLVACASLAGQCLAEGQARRGEMALRLALGATRADLVRQLACDLVIKVVISALLGSILALWIVQGVISVAPQELQGWGDGQSSPMVLVWGLAALATTGFLFSVGQVFLMPVADPKEVLAEAQSIRSASRQRLEDIVVAFQLSLSLMLVVAAGLMSQTLTALTNRPLGFDSDRLAVISIRATEFPQVVPAAGQMPLFASWVHTDQMINSVIAVPGVVSAAAASAAPFAGAAGVLDTTKVRVVGETAANDIDAHVMSVTEGYFETLKIAHLSGRSLEGNDRRRDPSDLKIRAVVSRQLERAAGGNLIGRRLQSVGSTSSYEIVGTVEDVTHRDQSDDPVGTIYVVTTSYASPRNLVVRTKGDPGPLLNSIRARVKEFDASIIVSDATTMSTLVRAASAAERFRATVATTFGLTALVLAAFGLYSFTARTADERTRDIGIRLALGATPFVVLRLFAVSAGRISAVALVVGLPAAVVAGYSLRSFLYGVSPYGIVELGQGLAILMSAVLLAVMWPLKRAMSLDPVAILRK